MSEADEQVQQSLSGTGVWDHFTMRDGLPDMKIECVFEDSQGVLWIGTHDRGVVRYDGDEFRSYTSRDGLTADGVFSVLEDSDGVLWFGTNRGLIRFDEVNFEHIAADEPYGLLWGSVLDKRGYLWFGLESRPEKPPAACYWDGEKLNLIELDVEATSQGKSIHRVLVDDTGKVWLAGYGLFRETRGGFGFEEVPCKFDDPILDFIQRRDCTFLIATDGGGLFGMRGGAMTRLASE